MVIGALLVALGNPSNLRTLLPLSGQPPEFPTEPATVSADAPADPAERRLAAHSAAGDRQGEPGAAAGESHRPESALLSFHLDWRSTSLGFFFLSLNRHCRRLAGTRSSSSRC